MPLPDDSPEKWEYKEHTRVKHDLLAKYLRAWISKLGSVHLRICYFDCFAGRGAYEGGVLGSPLIAMQLASREGVKDLYKELVCTFIEKNEENYNNLERLVKSEKETCPEQYEKIKVYCYNDAFVDVASQVMDKAGAKLAPSFFFIDPFGFGGVPFDLIRKILSIKRTEIFFTFMSRDINRFLESSAHGSVLNKLFGTEKWREISKNYAGEERYHRLRDLYIGTT